MSKIVLLRSVAKEYLSMKYAGRRNNKIMSMVKFSVVFLMLIAVAAIYAIITTTASTLGYDFEQQKDILADLEFSRSVENLHVITSEKEIRANMGLNNYSSRYAGHGSKMVTIDAHPAFVKK